MDLGVGLVQLTPDERRALRTDYNWKHLVERCLQRSLDMVEVFWNHRRTDLQILLIGYRMIIALDDEGTRQPQADTGAIAATGAIATRPRQQQAPLQPQAPSMFFLGL